MWQALTPTTSNESHLQQLFDGWSKAGCRRAGVPSWLREYAGPNNRTTRAAFGYEFTTDAEYHIPPRHYIIELKRAGKYEPLALAEVLHHAEWVRRHGGGSSEIIPVIVSSFNSWLRLAISALPQRTDRFGALRYYEVDVLEGTGADIVWFEEPLAPWTPAECPAFLHDHPESARLCWHHVPTTRSWIGTVDARAPGDARGTVRDDRRA
jgi:hypothetical protein